MKLTARIHLIANAVYLLVAFLFEAFTCYTYRYSFSTDTWVYRYNYAGLLRDGIEYLLPLCSMVFALIHAFMLTWKSNKFLIVSIAIYAFCFFISNLSLPYANYVTVPFYVYLPILAGYIACILLPKLPHRDWIAFFLIWALIAFLCVLYFLNGGILSVLTWAPRYAEPLIGLAFLGYILPQPWD